MADRLRNIFGIGGWVWDVIRRKSKKGGGGNVWGKGSARMELHHSILTLMSSIGCIGSDIDRGDAIIRSLAQK